MQTRQGSNGLAALACQQAAHASADTPWREGAARILDVGRVARAHSGWGVPGLRAGVGEVFDSVHPTVSDVVLVLSDSAMIAADARPGAQDIGANAEALAQSLLPALQDRPVARDATARRWAVISVAWSGHGPAEPVDAALSGPGLDGARDLPGAELEDWLEAFSDASSVPFRALRRMAAEWEDTCDAPRRASDQLVSCVRSVLAANGWPWSGLADLNRRVEPLFERPAADILTALAMPPRLADLAATNRLGVAGTVAIGRHEGPRAAVARVVEAAMWVLGELLADRAGRDIVAALDLSAPRQRVHVAGIGSAARAAAHVAMVSAVRPASLSLLWPTLAVDALSARRNGGFARLLEPDVVIGPIHLARDPDCARCAVQAPLAARLGGDRVISVANPDDLFSVMGALGPQGLGEARNRLNVTTRSRLARTRAGAAAGHRVAALLAEMMPQA